MLGTVAGGCPSCGRDVHGGLGGRRDPVLHVLSRGRWAGGWDGVKRRRFFPFQGWFWTSLPLQQVNQVGGNDLVGW